MIRRILISFAYHSNLRGAELSILKNMAFHSFKAANQIFEIPTRYSLIRPIGHGAYGVVISALDKESGEKVAIKKISGAFADPVDAKRILREIKLMKRFRHENVRYYLF